MALPLAYKGLLPGRRQKKAADMLERVGLGDRAFYFPSQLSGGQTQRAAIARALVNNPKIIIADEPTGNLDSAGSLLVMELLAEIHRSGNTILFVTHNPELTRYATRVVYMHDGAIVHDEQTALGEVAATARKVLYTLPVQTEDHDLAGISTLMKHVPGESDAKPEPKPKPKAKATKTTAKTKKRAPRKAKK